MAATLNHSQWVDTKFLSQPLLLSENPQDWKVSQNKGTTNCRKQNNLETKPCYGDRIQSRGAEAKNIRKFFFHPKKRHKLDSFFCNSCGSIIDFLCFCWKGISLRIFLLYLHSLLDVFLVRMAIPAWPLLRNPWRNCWRASPRALMAHWCLWQRKR